MEFESYKLHSACQNHLDEVGEVIACIVVRNDSEVKSTVLLALNRIVLSKTKGLFGFQVFFHPSLGFHHPEPKILWTPP